MASRAVRRKPEISRGEILDAALACFAAHGYHETSVDDIAACAGLSKGAIYWHFVGKRELFLALIDRFSEPALAELDLVAEAPDWRAALREIFSRVRLQLEVGMPLFKVALEYIALSARDDEIRVRAERAHGVWKAAVEKQIARGVAEGTLRSVAASEVGLVIDATIDGLMLAKLMRPELDLEAAWRAAEEIFWRGLKP
jgi:TetR/AcrR family acrAB operon transcriptional repressor